MKKHICYSLVSLFFVFSLCSCGMRTVDDMYSLPRRSSQNISLRTAVEAAMVNKSYAAPLSGENQESVQTADLDGDGRLEYLVFAKDNSDGTLRILVFRQIEEQTYELCDSIPCKGTAFEQVLYANVNDCPGKELIIGTLINEKITKTASIYDFSTGQAEKQKSVIYQKMLVCDLDMNGSDELMIIQNGEGQTENGSVRLYSYVDGAIEGSVESMLSVPAERIRKIAVNKLSSGEPAVFVAGLYSENELLTDIFALKSGILVNVAQLNQMGTAMQTVRNNYVYAEDIDQDGLLELPCQVLMMYNTTEQNLIRWYNLDIDGVEENKRFTFHNYVDGWYFDVDSEWIDRLFAEKNGNVFTFYMWNNSSSSAVPVFSIYTFSGRDRDAQASMQNRFALYRGENVVISAKLESASTIYGVSEGYLASCFHLIRQDWKATES